MSGFGKTIALMVSSGISPVYLQFTEAIALIGVPNLAVEDELPFIFILISSHSASSLLDIVI